MQSGSCSPPKSALSRFCRRLSPKRAKQQHSLDSFDHISSTSSSPCATTTTLQQVFGYLDEDGDGKISPAELQSCVNTMGGKLSSEEAMAAVRSSDSDGDGLLGFEDFRSLMEESCSEEERREELKLAFSMYENKPGSGCITPSSLKRMLTQLGESTSIDDCKAMIHSFDLNGDGVLSFQEFSLMMR